MEKYNFLYLKNNVENKFIKKNIPIINIGDSIKVKILIKEGNKNRVQISEGVIISKKNTTINQSITIRKIVQNVGVEKIYLIHSPLIIDIEIISRAKVRKSKLYYLRKRSGKATKLKIQK
uniref:Large ribosomal subunit protein bL19c n=1 Tax=Caloglossa beccarii TaxID=131038 RepID=A0A1Z1M8R5_9FLOR|nr:ribosomal protein L19 [Caloglossa beccarii]ARW62360.1 ribosomal protein L19 [Caloglossa beccarii]